MNDPFQKPLISSTVDWLPDAAPEALRERWFARYRELRAARAVEEKAAESGAGEVWGG
jgi:hypothetical protein